MLAAQSLSEILQSFQIEGILKEVKPFGSGHINLSFLANFESNSSLKKYLLQKVNTTVFHDVPALMRNIERVSAHLNGKPNFELKTLKIVPTTNGKSYHLTRKNEYWRVFDFIDHVNSYDRTPSALLAKAAAIGCAKFQIGIIDLSPACLTASIPEFQNVSLRLKTLESALREDPLGRARAITEESEFLLSRKKYADNLDLAVTTSRIPLRAVHADLKINNILFSCDTGEAACIIDWDTLMPGTLIYDFGDFSRSTCLRAEEDQRDLSKVTFDLSFFEALTEGYLGELSSRLALGEIEMLPDAPKLIALSLASRFLSDHIYGDHYFRIERENQNLDRARVQLKLLEDMESKSAQITKIIGRFRSA